MKRFFFFLLSQHEVFLFFVNKEEFLFIFTVIASSESEVTQRELKWSIIVLGVWSTFFTSWDEKYIKKFHSRWSWKKEKNKINKWNTFKWVYIGKYIYIHDWIKEKWAPRWLSPCSNMTWYSFSLFFAYFAFVCRTNNNLMETKKKYENENCLFLNANFVLLATFYS